MRIAISERTRHNSQGNGKEMEKAWFHLSCSGPSARKGGLSLAWQVEGAEKQWMGLAVVFSNNEYNMATMYDTTLSINQAQSAKE